MSDTILTDTRKIRSVWFSDHTSGYRVGLSCDEIQPYAEPGSQAYVPWFAIKQNGKVIARVNAAHVAVVRYGED